ncbi:unnamed protein product [Ilex paraguariensis]|uniref:Uncharacterized protein n=1 Tax=Ilex paraguariensis TaxID=185542 RepID=A0ABC8RGT8_9AQUA
MKDCREDEPCCYFHPKEVVVGVCALCLNERLLILAAKQGQLHQTKSILRSYSLTNRKSSITIPKIFALSSLLNRLDIRHRKSEENDDTDASASHEDNGAASWEKGTVSKVSLEHCNNMNWNHSLSKEARGAKSVVEHAKPPASLRWRKRIGHLFQLIRWKRSSSKGNVCHVGGKLERVKGRYGWIRTLTKRRTKE